MNAVTTRATSKSFPPPAITRDFDRLVGRLTNAVEQEPGGPLQVSERFAPSEPERGIIQGRIDTLTDALSRRDAEDPRSPETIHVRTMVAALLGGLATMGAGDGAAKLKISLCVSALQPFPVWAIERACALVRNGETGLVLGSKDIGLRLGYPPEAPQLAELCRHIVAPVQHERAELHRLLSAKVYREPTEAEIARRDDVVAKALASFKGSNAPDRERQKAEIEYRKREADEQLKTALAAPVEVSPALRARLDAKLGREAAE